ncbi:hypothetical protein HHI36_023540 [Cryptolaemus montrouzieri]|uniref:Uncharacterized protein n=1 Tax=Cryptolaemus montrouzieri TaxID=559131 RepID=A0ABD2PIL8_9CUCU
MKNKTDSIMFAITISCLLVLQGVRGIYLFPAWRHAMPQNLTIEETPVVINKTHTTPEAKMYFENFNFKKLNPVYWFYDSSEDDKVEELYNLVKCIIEEDGTICKKKLQTSKKIFEKEVKSKKDSAKHKENSTEQKEELENRKSETSKTIEKKEFTSTIKPSTSENISDSMLITTDTVSD